MRSPVPQTSRCDPRRCLHHAPWQNQWRRARAHRYCPRVHKPRPSESSLPSAVRSPRPSATQCRTAHPPYADDAPRRFQHRIPRSECLAAISSNLKVTFTPTLMLGANTIDMSLDAASSSSFCSGENPVVPITIFTPGPTSGKMRQRSFRTGEINQYIACPKAPEANIIGNLTPHGAPINSPASFPSKGYRHAPAQPSIACPALRAMASSKARPIRPELPATAIFNVLISFQQHYCSIRVLFFQLICLSRRPYRLPAKAPAWDPFFGTGRTRSIACRMIPLRLAICRGRYFAGPAISAGNGTRLSPCRLLYEGVSRLNRRRHARPPAAG